MAKISTNAEINSIRLKEQASAPDTPASGYMQLYTKGDGKLYYKDDTGVENCINPMTTAGDLIYGGTDGAPTRLAKGAEGKVLTQGATNPTWSDSLINPMTAAGDIIVGGVDGAATRLVKGNRYQSLVVGASAPEWGNHPYFPPFTTPVLTDFAWINQGTATAVEENGGINLTAAAAAAANHKILKKSAPSTPYTITAIFRPNIYPQPNSRFGLLFRNSSDGKEVTHALTCLTSPTFWHWLGEDFSGPTAYVSNNFGVAFSLYELRTPFIVMRIADDGTNRICSWSADGFNFRTLHSEGRTTYTTADEVGFFVSSDNDTYPAAATLLSWVEG